MKKFAFFLPQFHRIPENDEWWGEGFTEWTNVKAAKPLFRGHVQPQIPLNNNYYNLLDKETVLWQTELMKNYHVDGFIYYHYYFSGKMLLEKPAENLLKWTDIQQPFFFCWANHSWRRTWNGEQTVLLDQTYGDESDWRAHFEYLLPFFRDERYEKKNNKPLFMIYDPAFPEMREMFLCFDKWCRESGFNGLCLIESSNVLPDKERMDRLAPPTEYIFLREPAVSTMLYSQNNSSISKRIYRKAKRIFSKLLGVGVPLVYYSGSALYQHMIHDITLEKNMLPGIMFSWDNTPRHKYNGYIITPPTKGEFFQYMDKIKDCEYAFINAWNEWCEGMILEPTQSNGYRYLEWISQWCEEHKNQE